MGSNPIGSTFARRPRVAKALAVAQASFGGCNPLACEGEPRINWARSSMVERTFRTAPAQSWAYGSMVEYSIRIAGTAVRFCLGPPHFAAFDAASRGKQAA